MRFDTLIELFIVEDIQDGLGGNIEAERPTGFKYAMLKSYL